MLGKRGNCVTSKKNLFRWKHEPFQSEQIVWSSTMDGLVWGFIQAD